MRIRSVGAELVHSDGRTDMTKLIVAFRKFANAPDQCSIHTEIRVIPHRKQFCIRETN